MASCNSNLYFRVLLIALLPPLASGDCIDLDLGMESNAITDSQISASSELNGNTPAKHGRLNYTAGQAWCASISDSSPYLQIDLKTLHIICAVSTQGNTQSTDWVKTYTLKTSTDGITWTDYEDVGHVKNFTGNSDQTTVKKNILYEGALTRWLRFVVATKHNQYSCMRTEVFGVKYRPENLAAGKTTGQSSNYSGGVSAKAVDGNADTDFDNGHCSHTNADNPSWWHVDLGLDNVPVSEVRIVNRFSPDSNVQQRNQDYKIALGNDANVRSNPECEGTYTFIQFIASAVCYRNPLNTGRYLGILTTKSQILQLCEVEVYSRDNLAYNKNTAQISTYSQFNGGLAVDGNSKTGLFSGRSCTHTLDATNPWWRVDLGQVEPVTEVYIVNRGDCCGDRLDPFEIRVGTSSNNGGITNPKCGDGGYSVPQGQGASFFCRPSLYGRYVTIRITKLIALTLCEVEVYSARRACPIQSLGLHSSYVFPDSSFSASTSGSGKEASKGRLNGNGAWSPSTNDDANDYLQINLQYEFFICAVATQGSSTADHWTTKYKLLLSLNNTDRVTYQENNADKIFNANDGKNDIVKHMLVGINRARFIRFQPTDYNNGKALRVEVYGLLKPAGPSQAPASFNMESLTSTSVRASWQLPPTDSIFGIIIGYKLLYRNKSSAGDPLTVITIGSNSTLTRDVTGLGIYTEYEFQVLAFSSIGNGPRSVQVVRTKEEAPSQAPTSFTVAAASSTSITANWQLPPAGSRNGIIRGFKLFYKKKSPADSPTTTKTINDNDTRSEIVTGLDKYTQYEFQVLAFTFVGDGPNSSVEVERTKQDAPSQAPTSFAAAAESSTSITANWQLPPADYRNGIITGFKLFYKKKSPADSPTTTETINDKDTLSKIVTGLDKYTEYEFQVLAFTYVGDGPNSSVEVERTMEDAPSAPEPLDYSIVAPSAAHGPRINLTWSIPHKENGIIRNYTVFFSHNEGQHNIQGDTFGKNIFSYLISAFGGVSYQFIVRAVTVKPGTNASLLVDVPEYAPTVGPENVTLIKVNGTTFNISWASLTRDYGTIIAYEVTREKVSSGPRSRRSNIDKSSINSTETFAVLYDFEMCSVYSLSVRGYTGAGPGVYSPNKMLQTSKPDKPKNLTVKYLGATNVTLEWKQPLLTPKEGLDFTIKYTGKKEYDEQFSDSRSTNANKATTYTLTDLIPGTSYSFEVYGVSKCGDSLSITVNNVKTDIAEPLAPDVSNVSAISVSESSAIVQLWPAKQTNGPISAYQVIVQKVADGVTDLPADYGLELKNSEKASESDLNFYIAAEINNDPVLKVVWKFTVGDEKDYGGYLNSALEKGQVYNVYQRAISIDKNVVLEGKYSKVAKVSVAQVTNNSEGSKDSLNTTAVVVPVVLLLLFIPLVVIVLLLYRRRKRSQRESDKKLPVKFDAIGSGTPQSTSSNTNLVYENAMEMDCSAETNNQIYQNVKDNAKSKQAERIYQNTKKDTTNPPANQVYQNVADMRNGKDAAKANPSEVKEPIYSEAEDGKPRPIIASEFAAYFKSKSSNGAAVLRQEFKDLPGGMLSTWEVAKNNKIKNRYGNIVTYDHSRVVLEKIEGDPKSDYINATYIPTYDEKTMCYIATQGPNTVTTNDFWRMIWQENCNTIVMLTNIIEQGKVKCEQYWPDNSSKFGDITVTVQKTETFADYLIRTFILVKDSEKREVLQYHYITWPDRGVPHHSTALLAFRWKVHVRHQLTGGPLVVHCSAGVGRTGTYLAIDAMLESAKEQNSVFIPNYVHVMRKQRPHMIQKEEQYVFLHQAVMEALVCGNTEIAPQDLLIRMNKLARVHKASKQTGYSQEFKRLKFISEFEGSEDDSTAAFKPANIHKNRFPNIVPLDSARPFLRSSDPDKDYINASFVDDYIQRNAYVLTQAPLDNTIDDFWRMVSQYDIRTVVMLNSLKEGKEVYPQYWPFEGVVRYGNISLEMLAESTANNITTRKFSVLDAESPKEKSTVHHLQFTGWTDANSCPDPKEIIQLLTAIQKSQQQTGNGVIVFQCSDGVGRSGVVSTIMSTIERIKNEQTVDVFQTVNMIRVKRPGAVANVEQYTFCYKTIQAYLDSFNAYSNFSEC